MWKDFQFSFLCFWCVYVCEREMWEQVQECVLRPGDSSVVSFFTFCRS